MILSRLLFPARCPFCSKIISVNTYSCDNCIHLTEIDPYIQKLANGCKCISAFPHKDFYRKAVLNYKFYNNKQYYVQFSLILKKIIEENLCDIKFDIFSAVPIHRKKQSERGFDQVEILAKETARITNSFYKSTLEQTELNQSQHKLDKKHRKNNVHGIYRCIDKNTVYSKSILLFDDIITTGSTLCECSNVLIENGAKEVCCITINY